MFISCPAPCLTQQKSEKVRHAAPPAKRFVTPSPYAVSSRQDTAVGVCRVWQHQSLNFLLPLPDH